MGRNRHGIIAHGLSSSLVVRNIRIILGPVLWACACTTEFVFIPSLSSCFSNTTSSLAYGRMDHILLERVSGGAQPQQTPGSRNVRATNATLTGERDQAPGTSAAENRTVARTEWAALGVCRKNSIACRGQTLAGEAELDKEGEKKEQRGCSTRRYILYIEGNSVHLGTVHEGEVWLCIDYCDCFYYYFVLLPPPSHD